MLYNGAMSQEPAWFAKRTGIAMDTKELQMINAIMAGPAQTDEEAEARWVYSVLKSGAHKVAEKGGS